MTGDEPGKLLEGALYELLRGTKNTQSALRGHDLLSDLYGNDGFVGRVVGTSRNATTDGQLVEMAFRVEYGMNQGPVANRPADYFNGAVITMVSGPAGLSARIVRSSDNVTIGQGGIGRLFAEAFTSDQNELIDPQQADLFVVNGVPFNGTGFGYNPATGQLDLQASGLNSKTGTWDVPVPRAALAPNFKAIRAQLDLPADFGGAG